MLKPLDVDVISLSLHVTVVFTSSLHVPFSYVSYDSKNNNNHNHNGICRFGNFNGLVTHKVVWRWVKVVKRLSYKNNHTDQYASTRFVQCANIVAIAHTHNFWHCNRYVWADVAEHKRIYVQFKRHRPPENGQEMVKYYFCVRLSIQYNVYNNRNWQMVLTPNKHQ